MGLLFSNLPSENLIFVKNECEINVKNKQFLINMFSKEFNIMCVKWNHGKLYGYHFNACSHIINYLDDKYLFVIYDRLINK